MKMRSRSDEPCQADILTILPYKCTPNIVALLLIVQDKSAHAEMSRLLY